MIIQLLDGTRYDVEDYGLKRLFHIPPSAEIAHTKVTIDGVGERVVKSTIGQRTIPVDLLYQVRDIYAYYLLRDKLNAVFMRDEPFYIIFKRESYQRWFVRISEGYTLPPNPKGSTFTLNFRTESKYAQSVGTTQDLKTWDSGLWGWNDTINWDDDFTYRFNTNTFTLKNLGNVKIDPRESDLEIVIKATASSYLELKNNTTGDVYRFNGPLTANDTLTIRGVQSFKNTVGVFKNTNHKLISLAVGDNSFTVTGGTISDINFIFRFLYK